MKNKNISRFVGFFFTLLSYCPVTAFAEVHHIPVNINQPAPFIANAGQDITLCPGTGDTLHASDGSTYKWNPAQGLSCTDCQNPYANPTATTAYTVEITGANGCKATDTVIVTVSSSIVANAGRDTSVCKGDSIQLLAEGGKNYTWSPATGLSNPNIADPKASPDVTTTYTVIVSGGGDCHQDTDKMTVTVIPKPPVPTIAQTGASGESLHSSAPTGNQWYRNGVAIVGATSQDYTITENGNYTVVVTGSNGCSSTSKAFTYTSGVESEIAHSGTPAFMLYPNPNNGTFTVLFNANEIADYDIELRDVLGRLIHEEHLEKFIGHYSNRFDIAFYPKGFYSLLVRNGTERRVVKVLKY